MPHTFFLVKIVGQGKKEPISLTCTIRYIYIQFVLYEF